MIASTMRPGFDEVQIGDYSPEALGFKPKPFTQRDFNRIVRRIKTKRRKQNKYYCAR